MAVSNRQIEDLSQKKARIVADREQLLEKRENFMLEQSSLLNGVDDSSEANQLKSEIS